MLITCDGDNLTSGLTETVTAAHTFDSEQSYNVNVSKCEETNCLFDLPYPNIFPRKNLSDSDFGYVCGSCRMWLNAFASSV